MDLICKSMSFVKKKNQQLQDSLGGYPAYSTKYFFESIIIFRLPERKLRFFMQISSLPSFEYIEISIMKKLYQLVDSSEIRINSFFLIRFSYFIEINDFNFLSLSSLYGTYFVRVRSLRVTKLTKTDTKSDKCMKEITFPVVMFWFVFLSPLKRRISYAYIVDF
ncbi:unnamed protein product [Phytomonas sp. EM1]|nr:unnamed protein product [Phytomonas sp. EM1]|eukprot:CCW63965.1 unnamed protein product [Phytomonas sp. isolate EM1]